MTAAAHIRGSPGWLGYGWALAKLCCVLAWYDGRMVRQRGPSLGSGPEVAGVACWRGVVIAVSTETKSLNSSKQIKKLRCACSRVTVAGSIPPLCGKPCRRDFWADGTALLWPTSLHHAYPPAVTTAAQLRSSVDSNPFIAPATLIATRVSMKRPVPVDFLTAMVRSRPEGMTIVGVTAVH